MNTKADWINEFESRIKEDFPYIKGDQPYQLATAYFNFATDGGAEETVDEAYARYYNLQIQVPVELFIPEE
jgi:hypothetical protein